MHKRSCLWKLFGNQHVRESKKLLKYGKRHLNQTCLSLWGTLNKKEFLLLESQTFWLLVNTLAVDHDYSCSSRENLLLPIQIQLSKKHILRTFYRIFEIYIEYWTFEKKMLASEFSISEIIDTYKRVFLSA